MATWIFMLGGLWMVLIGIAAAARAVDTRPGVAGSGLAELVNRLYARLFHGLRVRGGANVRAALAARGDRALVVVSNHKAGVDGLLISAAVPFYIRWMMAADMKAPGLEAAYEFAGLIFVSREAGNKDLAGMREALRHLAAGDVLGIFPEGRLCRYRGQIYPFQPGVGLLIAKSRALVLPVVLRESPIRSHAYTSLVTPSRSVVEFMAPIDYAAAGLKAGEITKDLEKRYVGWVGPVNFEPPKSAMKE